MEATTLVQFIYEAGNELVARCELVKQCHSESTRIAVRTVRALGSLEEAANEFSGNPKFGASLIDLKRVLEEAHDLVKRCQRPKTIGKRLRAIALANANRDALVRVEDELKRITDDLQVPMLADIRRVIQQVHDRETGSELDEKVLQKAVQEAIGKELDARSARGRGSVREIIEAKLSSTGAVAPASGSDLAGQVMLRLGRVRFDMLDEGEDILGEGTFGVVQSGEYMGEEVAIKKARGIVGDPAVLREFRREAEVHFAMHHDSIVRVLAFFEGSPQRPPFLVMERMEESLSSLLGVLKDPLPFGERLEFIKEICQALLFLHQHRIIHRDVKSANVLIDARGSAKLSDFGLAVIEATVAASTLSNASSMGASAGTGQKVGSAYYMAPEVHASTNATSASDVFSLHVVMWEILTHTRVGVGSPIGEQLRRSPDAKLLVGSSVPGAHHDGIQALLDGCGHVDRKQRPRMEEVLEDVGVFLQDVNDVPRPVESAKDAATDRDALMKVFEATGGGSWKQSSGWGTSRPLREWHGVTVDSRNRVMQIDLGENNLQGPIPAALGELTALSELRLHMNQLAGEIPPALGRLANLTFLNLGSNNLSRGIPAALGELTGLTFLRLDTNQLAGEIPPALGRLTALTTLYLSNNKLSGGIPAALGELTRLTFLSLYINQLTGEIPPALGRLTALTTLDVAINKLSGGIPAALGELTGLTFLRLHTNQLAGEIPPALGRLSALTTLDVAINKLSGGIPAALGELTGLTFLRLYTNQFTGEIPPALGRLTALTTLDLGVNKLRGGIPAALGELTRLTFLSLYINQLTGEIPPALGRLTALTTLDVPRNKLSGGIPAALGELTGLAFLGLHTNQLTGAIPPALSKLTALKVLNLHTNQLTGTKTDIERMLPNCAVHL